MNISGRKKSILIIDDDPVYMKMVHEWLKDDFKVTMTISGGQALDWLKENKADLILLDYDLPVMPGPQILEKIRSGADSKETPVMILTGQNDRESIMRILSLSPADYLLKNIKRDELRGKVLKFLK